MTRFENDNADTHPAMLELPVRAHQDGPVVRRIA
jgi:hypothetical protein